MVNRVSRGNTIPFVTPSSAMRYDWTMSARSPFLLNSSSQYNEGFISSTGVLYRPFSSTEGLGRGIDASTYALYFAFFTRPVEYVSDAVIREACYLFQRGYVYALFVTFYYLQNHDRG
jgi:hypothetical protein